MDHIAELEAARKAAFAKIKALPVRERTQEAVSAICADHRALVAKHFPAVYAEALACRAAD